MLDDSWMTMLVRELVHDSWMTTLVCTRLPWHRHWHSWTWRSWTMLVREREGVGGRHW